MQGMRDCPVCGHPSARATLWLEERIDPARLTDMSYASRKEPEYMTHRLLRCPDCGLAYAAHPPPLQALATAYRDAAFDSGEEAGDAAEAYARAILPMLSGLPARGSVLDIGTGTGAFLERMRGLGFEQLAGIEPSAAAVERAPERLRGLIRNDVFRVSDFSPGSFDLITCFMTLEHVLDPTLLAADAFTLLRPGGAFVTVTHDRLAPLNRLLGSRSPIIDIEHLQLFDRRSIRRLFERCGYQAVRLAGFQNRYALRYWIRLAPLPRGLKTGVLRAVEASGLAARRLSFDVGNLMTCGYKPSRACR